MTDIDRYAKDLGLTPSEVARIMDAHRKSDEGSRLGLPRRIRHEPTPPLKKKFEEER